MLRSIFSTVVALVTIFVLTFLMVLQGPQLLSAWVSALPERRQERVRRVAADCAKALGYMTGNLVITSSPAPSPTSCCGSWACPTAESSPCSLASPT